MSKIAPERIDPVGQLFHLAADSLVQNCNFYRRI